ncbi:hypothetical protein SAMN05421810_10764 [Amycolatopsis arida]|uniref:Uncharacterized protein n=1 Tax=Amycolatopsis arida TaxID=587909 RepID=A0A1I5YCD8_9PSEU|nr:hypothetical protein [Amycolatopsis arida]TDX90420.1 hypothetical protein CLV69_10764 [Amycolatopsis arida]SFQ41849.1 hypothetical protein SAMN05421810_10764 [Amycolatopsis arida]
MSPRSRDDDSGIGHNANRPGTRGDAFEKVFRDSVLNDRRFDVPLVALSGLFLVLCVGGVVVRETPLPLIPADAFVVALYSLWRLRAAATYRQLAGYGWLAGGGTAGGLALTALIVRPR